MTRWQEGCKRTMRNSPRERRRWTGGRAAASPCPRRRSRSSAHRPRPCWRATSPCTEQALAAARPPHARAIHPCARSGAAGAVTKFRGRHWGVPRRRRVRFANGGRNCCSNKSVNGCVCGNVLADLRVGARVRMLVMGSRRLGTARR